MSLADRFLKRDKFYINKNTFNENTLKILREGTLIGVSRSIIIDYIEKFNIFNRKGEFEIKMGVPDIRHYYGEDAYCPSDLSTVGTFRDNINSINFIQVFFPKKSIYVILDHILAGQGQGEYKRKFSKIEQSLLKKYFEFYNLHWSMNEALLYTGMLEMSPAFPLKQLFSQLNIVVAYIPLLFYNQIFSEAVVRINLDVLKDIVETTNESNKEDDKTLIKEEPINFFSISKLSKDENLDLIINNIIN